MVSAMTPLRAPRRAHGVSPLRRSSRSSRSSRIRRTRLVLCGVVGGLLIAGGVTEAVARERATELVADRVETQFDTRPDVDFGAVPVTLQLLRGSFAHVEVSGQDATFRWLTGMDLHAELNEVSRTGNGASVGDSTVRAEMSEEAFAESIVAVTDGAVGQNATVTTDPSSSELVVHAGSADRLRIAFRPVLADEVITLELAGVSLGGREISGARADELTEGTTPPEVDLSGLPLDLEARRLTVTEEGVRLDLVGGHATVGS